MSSGPAGTAPQPLLTLRVIGAAMVMGVIFFAVVAWFITGGGTRPMWQDLAAGSTLVYVWIALTFAAAMAAMVIWRTRAAPLLGRSHAQDKGAGRAASLTRALVVIWALLEGQALTGLVLYLLSGSQLAYYGGPAVMIVGFAMSFPKAEWFGING